jgi:hypothetical protein
MHKKEKKEKKHTRAHTKRKKRRKPTTSKWLYHKDVTMHDSTTHTHTATVMLRMGGWC